MVGESLFREEHRVIRCGREHIDAIGAIYNDAILNTTALYEYEPRSAEVMVAWFAGKEAAGLPVLGVVKESGVLAGFATWGPFRPFPAYCFSAEHSVYVDNRFRGQGVGQTLLNAILAEASAAGLHTLIGGIDSTNVASISLHKKLGFTHCGTIREAGFKFGRWLDLDFWQKTVPAIKSGGHGYC